MTFIMILGGADLCRCPETKLYRGLIWGNILRIWTDDLVHSDESKGLKIPFLS